MEENTKTIELAKETQAQNETEPQVIVPIKRKRGRPTKVSQGVLPVNKATKTLPEDKNSPEVKAERLTNLLRVTGSKYDTFNTEEYQARLDNMTLSDLQVEGTRVGIKPVGDRSLTTRTLMELFIDEVRKFSPSSGGIDKSNVTEDKRAVLANLMKFAK